MLGWVNYYQSSLAKYDFANYNNWHDLQTFKICTVEIFKAIIFAARNKICSEAIKVSKYFY